MKYCKKCEKNYESNVDICPICGEKLETTGQENNGIYNIKNPFLELENAQILKNNQGNNTMQSVEFSTINNINNVIPESSIINNPTISNVNNNINNVIPEPSTINNPTTNNVESNIDKISESQKTIQTDDVKTLMADITMKSSTPVIKEEKKEEPTVLSNDGFLVLTGDKQAINRVNEEETKENLERLKKLNNPVLDFDPEKIKEEKEKSEQEAKLKLEEEMKAPKYMSYTYIILAAIMLFLTIIPIIYDFQIITLIHHLVIVVLLVIAYKLAQVNKKISSLVAIATSLVMILTILEKDYVTLILGIMLLLIIGYSYTTKDKKLKN